MKIRREIAKQPKLIVMLRSYDGDDTRLRVDPDPLFMVVNAETGAEVDNGYRTYEQAKKASRSDKLKKSSP